jgi:hypothetical protein
MAREYNIHPVVTEHACSANLVLSGRTFCVRQKDVNEMIRHPASRRAEPGKSGGFNGSTQHQLEIYLQDFEGLNPFATVDSKETKPCLGLIEYSPGQRFFAEELWAQSIKEVLRRPSEPAVITRSASRRAE